MATTHVIYITESMWYYLISFTRFDGIDAVEIDSNPVTNHNRYWILFYIAFMIFGNYITWNLFSAIVVDAYFDEKSKAGELGSLTKEQAEWVKINQTILDLKPDLQVKKKIN